MDYLLTDDSKESCGPRNVPLITGWLADPRISTLRYRVKGPRGSRDNLVSLCGRLSIPWLLFAYAE
jgi:hypothetical protein